MAILPISNVKRKFFFGLLTFFRSLPLSTTHQQHSISFFILFDGFSKLFSRQNDTQLWMIYAFGFFAATQTVPSGMNQLKNSVPYQIFRSKCVCAIAIYSNYFNNILNANDSNNKMCRLNIDSTALEMIFIFCYSNAIEMTVDSEYIDRCKRTSNWIVDVGLQWYAYHKSINCRIFITWMVHKGYLRNCIVYTCSFI